MQTENQEYVNWAPAFVRFVGACVVSLTAILLLGCQPATPQAKLSRAIRMGRLPEINQFIADGMDVTAEFENGSTGLHLLAQTLNPSTDVAALLIDAGVDVNATDAKGGTAWEVAWNYHNRSVNSHQADFLAQLLNGGFQPPRPAGPDGMTFLHTVAMTCKSATLTRRLAEDAELEAGDDNGWTPLHYAAFHGNYEAADGLLLAGANPNAETKKMVFETFLKGETTYFRFRYEAGSRPIDLYNKGHSRLTKDLRQLLEKHGGQKNESIENKFPHRGV